MLDRESRDKRKVSYQEGLTIRFTFNFSLTQVTRKQWSNTFNTLGKNILNPGSYTQPNNDVYICKYLQSLLIWDKLSKLGNKQKDNSVVFFGAELSLASYCPGHFTAL